MASSSRNPKSWKTSRSSPFPKYLPEPPPNLLPSSKSELFSLLAVVAIAGSVAVFCNFFVSRFNHQPKPFCDTDSYPDTSASVGYDLDYCEPCPKNGLCKEGKLECARGYREQGILCVEDKDINAAARTLSELIEVQVCKACAQYLCHGTGSIWVRKDELWTYMDHHNVKENNGLDENTYIVAKVRAIERKRKLLETRSNAGGFEEFKCPESLVGHYKPISCRAREWLVEHAFVIVPVSALLIGCITVLFKAHRRCRFSVRVEELYDQVCHALEENALISRSTNGESEPWVVASWLRDYLLSPKERKDPKLWKKVEELVQEDSRLDRYQKIVKGECKVVWEWQVEGSLSSSRKRKKALDNRPESTGGISTVFGQQNLERRRGSQRPLMS